MREITPGYTAEVSVTVTADKLASAVGSGSLDVFATPMMAALMEQAACEAAAPFLEEGETTVGTELSIRHTAATPQGMTVTARAELLSANGRELTLRVSASDTAGEIGSGTHKRFVVDAERFRKKAEARGK
ncbi:MAG: thioesterase family protein [Oscillospiraceae bacterium]|nr:thioesterase family protein [Oscillospiraceae bacterium]